MRHLLLLAAVFTCAWVLVKDKIASAPFGYDEADYKFASGLGIGTHWTGAGTMPLMEFIQLGLGRGRDPGQKTALSAIARGGSDPETYRHWHGPLYYYLLAIPSAFGTDEHLTRGLNLIFPALAALAIYFGSLVILKGTEGQLAALLTTVLFLWSPITLETTELAPHMLFLLLYVCVLLLLARAAVDGERKYFYGAAVCAGASFCAMEVAFIPVLVLMIFAWRHRKALACDWTLIRNSVTLFVATVLALWPAALYKLSFIKSYLVLVYLSVFRKGAWGNVTFAQTWFRRFQISPAEWCLFAVALTLLVVQRRQRTRAGALTFLLFAGLMIFVMLRVYAEGPRYMTPFSAALNLFTGWILASGLARVSRAWLRNGAVVAICALLLWSSSAEMSRHLQHEDPRPAAALRALRAGGFDHKVLLASRLDVPMLHYYFPSMRVEGYTEPAEIERVKATAHVDGILYPDYSLTMETPAPQRP